LDSPKIEEMIQEAELAHREVEEELALKGSKHFQPGRLRYPPEDELGTRLKEAREAQHLTQGELATLTVGLDAEERGVSRAVISLYEKGTNRPSPREVRLLCEALRITPNFLIYGRETPFDPVADYHRLGTIDRRGDPEGYAWVAYVMSIIHHNHYDAVMKLILDLARGWDKDFDVGLQEKANEAFLHQADALRDRLAKRAAAQAVERKK